MCWRHFGFQFGAHCIATGLYISIYVHISHMCTQSSCWVAAAPHIFCIWTISSSWHRDAPQAHAHRCSLVWPVPVRRGRHFATRSNPAMPNTAPTAACRRTPRTRSPTPAACHTCAHACYVHPVAFRGRWCNSGAGAGVCGGPAARRRHCGRGRVSWRVAAGRVSAEATRPQQQLL